MEHPDITRMNRYGTLATGEEKEPVCPVCGKECESFYKHKGEIVGCDMCIRKVDAYE
jgi:hypothetical protein